MSTLSGFNGVIDLSHHQRAINWQTVRDAGIVAVIHKATEGATFRDPAYVERREAARAAGLLWGSYHYAGTAPVADQVANYLAHADPGAGDLVCLDYEPQPSGAIMAPSDLVDLAEAVHARLGGTPAGHEFTDMHDWGDMLVHAGFAEPVMDMERIVLTWGSPEAALAELRTLGRNLHPGRFPALRGRGWKKALIEALAGLAVPGEHDGRIALTFEVIYGHAFRPTARVSVANESAVSLSDMKAMLGRGRSGGAPGPGDTG